MSQLQNIYANISPYFKLLYAFDLEIFSQAKLKQLLRSLKNKEELSASLKTIYDKLEETSKKNILDKLKMKKDNKKSVLFNDHSQLSNFSESSNAPSTQSSRRSQGESTHDQTQYQINESLIMEMPKTDYNQLQIKSGNIVGGQLMARFTLSDLIKQKSIQSQFYINTKYRISTISKETLNLLNLSSTNPVLLIDNRKQKFQVSNKNVLGLSYLQNNKIIMECNYRSQASSFQMIYTE